VKAVAGRGGRRVAALAIAAAALAVTGCTATSPGAGPAVAPSSATPAATGPADASTASAAESSAAAAASAVAAGEPECTAAGLEVSSGAYDAGAGHSSLTLTFTDNSAVPCFVQGYPGVALDLPGGGAYNAERTMIGYMGGDDAQSPARVLLAPEESASALIEWLHFPKSGVGVTADDCPGYAAVALAVTAPDQTTPARLAAPDPVSPVCWGFEVHPVVAGSTGQFPGPS
jgi:hypothetical protein